ncbi:MAG: hypothetical protein RL160_1792 [Bacteroidota bacterium]|jgi:hypothetical protein
MVISAAVCLVLGASACSDKDKPATEWAGSGMQVFYDEALSEPRSLRLFYYVPEKKQEKMPVLIVFHGIERNAVEYRDALISKAAAKGFILVVPEFSEEVFPGTNAYVLGNLYPDGELPNADSLRPAHAWSYAIVPRILQFVRMKTPAAGAEVYAIGHSAGAQFLHRALLFLPDLAFDAAVVSAAGWYTLPDKQVNFPYGTGIAPADSLNHAAFFQRKVRVQVGMNDNNPNSSTLRHTPEADAQGLHRMARAQYFHNRCAQLAAQSGKPFNWNLHLIPNLGHDFTQAINHSADLLFP